jgi:protein-S-isoprenylcysteine O-methyltransferase Ste14
VFQVYSEPVFVLAFFITHQPGQPMDVPGAFNGHPVYLEVWIATFWLCIVPEMILSAMRRSAKDAKKSDKGSKWIVIAAANLAMAIGFIVAFTLPSFAIRTHWKALFDLGIAIWLGGSLFRFYSMRILGRFFTYDVAISTGQQVVERGPYRWIRHPSYLGSLIANVGMGMTMTNWLALFLPALCLGAAYAYRIPIEERALQEGLGPAYREYMQRTRRLIPFVF